MEWKLAEGFHVFHASASYQIKWEFAVYHSLAADQLYLIPGRWLLSLPLEKKIW